MDGCEEVMGSSSDPISGFERETSDEFTATPLKKYVKFSEYKRGSACKWTCNYNCKKESYTGTYSRVRAHLIGLLPGQKAQGIALCPKVTKDERERMKKEEMEAQASFAAGKKTRNSAPIIPPIIGTKGSLLKGMFKEMSRNDVDGTVALYHFTSGVAFNSARSPFFYDMIRAVNEAPKGYKPPSSEKIRTILLDKERNNVEKALMPIKETWGPYGVTIVSDGWTNIKNQPLINVMAISGGRSMFLAAVDCSGEEKTGLFISELLIKAMDQVGIYNVVQVLTDNAPNCVRAGQIIEETHPHISWSGCMAHILSLLMKDIGKSKSSVLKFVGETYAKAKTIVDYIRNHSMIRYIFKKFSALEVVQAKKTRFGSHYFLLSRIVRVRSHLLSMVLSEEWEGIKKGKSKKVEHDDVRKIILDEEFWSNANLVLSFTKPIWIMIRFCDSDKAIIGQVYPRMEEMLEEIFIALSDHIEIKEVVELLVESRWEMMNCPLHCLAYVLTPFYYSKAWLRGGPTQRKKPNADPYVDKVYLSVVEKMVKDPTEKALLRRQLSDFMSNKGPFARPQAITDRETMPSLTWWDMYGASSPELYSLAIKVLSQSVNTSCAERAWSTYSFIHNVKRNNLNNDRAESLVYIHYNQRLLSRYRSDYEEFKNWDVYANDDNLDNTRELVEDREYQLMNEESISSIRCHGQSSNNGEGASQAKKARVE